MEETMTTPSEGAGESSPVPSSGSILGEGFSGGAESGQSPEVVDLLAFDVGWLPQELQMEPSLKNFDSLDKLAKSYVHLVKHMGVDADQIMRFPKEGDTSGYDSIYQRLGKPESAQNYELPESDGIDQYKEIAHQLNLTQDQASAVWDLYQQTIQNQAEQEQQSWQQTQAEYHQELQREFGKNAAQEFEFAKRAFTQFSDQEASELMDSTGLGNHPSIVKLFARIGRVLSEDGMLGPKDGVQGGLSLAQAEQLISQKQSDKDFMAAYTNKYHPQHAEAVEEMTKLFSYTVTR
jgi:hypothetical protein